LQELSDWLHLLASSSWGGTLLAIALTVSPSKAADNKENEHALADIADRFYAFFGPVFALLTATGLYNAWVEVGAFEPLWTTPYGRILFLKLLLFALLTVRYIAPPQHGKEDAAFALKFLRRARIEALFVLAILLCAALFTHEIPARHAGHTMPDHSHTMEHGHGLEKAKYDRTRSETSTGCNRASDTLPRYSTSTIKLVSITFPRCLNCPKISYRPFTGNST
jgi:uncharacterized membrane protein